MTFQIRFIIKEKSAPHTSKQSKVDGACYSLLIYVPRSIFLSVGQLGFFNFTAGYYVYTGRAKKGLHARRRRHHRQNKFCHWHIDYLTNENSVHLVDTFIHHADAKNECSINQIIQKIPSAQIMVPGFGASDCQFGCKSHLLYFNCKPDIQIYEM